VIVKPHKIHIFRDVTAYDRERISALCSVGLIKAYEIDENGKTVVNNTTSTPKSRRK
jgi:hypothetical protein